MSAILQRGLSHKLKDLRSFIVPCMIGDTTFDRAMLDLGVCINLIPYEVYKAVGLTDVKPIKARLKLAYQSEVYPMRIVEDVLMKVEELLILADFVVLKIEERLMLMLMTFLSF